MAFKSYYVLNGNLTSGYPEESTLFFSGTAIYEVIRLIHGKPLFIEDHFERLKNSAAINNFTITKTLAEISNQIESLAKQCRLSDYNVKLVVHLENNIQTCYIYFISTKYPNIKDYQTGITCTAYRVERANPNVKSVNVNLEIRKQINRIFEMQHVYEVLLLNQNDEITEGSKSNVFFIRNNKLYTAPDSTVLKGITRDKVIRLAQTLNLDVIYKLIKLSEISDYDAAFMTGTSPKILPISKIDNINFNTNNTLLKELIESYNSLINKWLNE